MGNITGISRDVCSKRRVVAILLAIIGLAGTHAQSQVDGQRTFSSSSEAVSTFIQAVRDGNPSNLLTILGPGSEQIISSGDDVADKAARERFVAQYKEKHSLTELDANEFTLNVGHDDWPLPIPLVNARGKWYFDGAAGRDELLYRRIGHNELSAISVCQGVVTAQRIYAAGTHDQVPVGTYAQRIISEPGRQNGLYWEVEPGQPPSAAGPLLAQAAQEGYDTSGARTPYHGYYYRLLNAQGSHAKGGAKSYVVNGKMSGGFALVAYPAEYHSSGVMTFMVDQDGVIYQKDLGESTSEIAQKITEYDPDPSWARAQ